MIKTTLTNSQVASLPGKCKTLNQFKQIHAQILKSNLNASVGSLLLATSKIPNFFPYAQSIFNRTPHLNTFMFNTMIRGYVRFQNPSHSLQSYMLMLHQGLEPNNYTFTPLVKACTILSHGSNLLMGRLIHAHVVEFGYMHDPFIVSSLIEFYSWNLDMCIARKVFDLSPKRDVVMWSAMIDGYGKIGDVENARKLFDQMPDRNVISWSAMMACYSRVSDFKEVILLFGQMQETGTIPNESVLVSVLTACANLGSLTQGLWVHFYVEQLGLGSNPILATAVANMYLKCGCLISALSIFDGIRYKDTGAWNNMISGAAMNGDVKKSIDLFRKMCRNGARPNETTFVAVLSACSHGSMVKQGLEFFEQMGSVYNVEPKIEHYACVVDLLARSGMLNEAERFIEEKMGERGDVNMWGALLGACRTYGNVEIGNRVWKKLAAKLGVNDCGIRVVAYNMYLKAGWVIEANRVRKTISNIGVCKKPGCSVIEVNGVFQEFLAGDLSHTSANQICLVLESLHSMRYIRFANHLRCE